MWMGWGRRAAVVVMSGAGLVGCTSGNMTAPDAAVALVGPTWRLTTIEGQAVLEGSKVTATFTNDSRVSGSAGCNGYFGRAQAESGRLSIGALGSTLMACAPDGVMSQETRYLAALQASSTYRLSGDELRLGRSASDVTLVYTSR
jgi:heat shock protein HslJ